METQARGFQGNSYRYFFDLDDSQFSGCREYALRLDPRTSKPVCHSSDERDATTSRITTVIEDVGRIYIPEGSRIPIFRTALIEMSRHGEDIVSWREIGIELRLTATNGGFVYATPTELSKERMKIFRMKHPLGDFVTGLNIEDYRNILNGDTSGQSDTHLRLLEHHPTSSAEVMRKKFPNPSSPSPPSPPVSLSSIKPRSFGAAMSKKDDDDYEDKNQKSIPFDVLVKKFAVDITAEMRGQAEPLLEDEALLDGMLKDLSKIKSANTCLIGRSGSGKTSHVSALARRINEDRNIPKILKNARILKFDLNTMSAGTKYRGQFEDRLRSLIKGVEDANRVKDGPQIILFFDEIHVQMNADGGDRDGAGQQLKTFLAGPYARVIGATTDDEYRKYIESDAGLHRRLPARKVEETTDAVTLEILNRWCDPLLQHHDLDEGPGEDDLALIVRLTNRHMPDRAQPGKSCEVLESAAAGADLRGGKKIENSDILRAVEAACKLPSGFLGNDDIGRALRLKDDLRASILGQPEVEKIADYLLTAMMNLSDPDLPMGIFIAGGPPGVGKSETAKPLARALGAEKGREDDRIVRIDMTRFTSKESISGLVGANAGYVGYDDESSLDQIARKAPCVVLLDEADKAHPDAFNAFLSGFNDGKQATSRGRVVPLKNVIFLLTSNAGIDKAAKDEKKVFGFGDAARSAFAHQRQALYDANAAIFGAPFMSRVAACGGFILYAPLTGHTPYNIACMKIKDTADRLRSRDGVNMPHLLLQIDDTVIHKLAKQGCSVDKGARELGGLVREKLENPLARWIAEEKGRPDSPVRTGENVIVTLHDINLDADDPFAGCPPTVRRQEIETAPSGLKKNFSAAGSDDKNNSTPVEKKRQGAACEI